MLSKASKLLLLITLQALFTISNCAEYRQIAKVFKPSIDSEGAGANVRRIIGTHENRRQDPFLMLDHFQVRLPGGFPDHPHRGFDTVTYMISGTFYHEDFMGNRGAINAGDLQWMTAGKGIVHSEMPASWDEDSNGFQLWLNLAKKDKFCDPEYQEIKKDKIPVVTKEKFLVKVISGESYGVKGPIVARTPTLYLDVEIQPNTVFEQIIPKGWNGLSYIYSGEAWFGPSKLRVEQNAVAVLKHDDTEVLYIETRQKGAKLIIIAGEPMNEEVVQQGPFVLSNKEDLQKSFKDYQKGQNGFEKAPGWFSKIKDLARDRQEYYNMDL